MDLVSNLLGADKVQSWLHACTAPRAKTMMVDWVGAPKDRRMRAVMIESYGDASELKTKTVDLPFELVGFLFSQTHRILSGRERFLPYT
jgi:hypothetical protein